MALLFDELDKLNFNKRIKIKARNLKTDFSLLLEFNLNGKRQREYLKIIIQGTKSLNKKELEKLYYVSLLRDQKELELFADERNFSLINQVSKIKFFDYYLEIAKKKTFYSYMGSLKHLKDFSKKYYGNTDLTFNNITHDFCNKFIEYLLTKIQQNTVRTYLNSFSAVLNNAVKEKIISDNPLKKGHIKYVDSKREFLTEKELFDFAKQDTQYRLIRNAFLFSCQTGLRLGDIRALTFKDIKEGYLYFRQLKTKGVERMKLSSDAIKILEEQKVGKLEKDNVFPLINSKAHLNEHLRSIVSSAMISKHISFHCGRHTFATRCITNGVDIYTVSKLLGHRDIKHTQIYAKLIDTKKDEYIDKIPQIL